MICKTERRKKFYVATKRIYNKHIWFLNFSLDCIFLKFLHNISAQWYEIKKGNYLANFLQNLLRLWKRFYGVYSYATKMSIPILKKFSSRPEREHDSRTGINIVHTPLWTQIFIERERTRRNIWTKLHITELITLSVFKGSFDLFFPKSK